jgi:membrane protease YdiL (CAAX protease family)
MSDEGNESHSGLQPRPELHDAASATPPIGPYQADAQSNVAPPSPGTENPPWSGSHVIIVFAVFIASAAFIAPVIIFSVLRAKLGSRINFEQLANDGRFAAAAYLMASIPTLALMWMFASHGQESASRALRLALPERSKWNYVLAGVIVGVVAATAEVLLPIPKDLPMTKLFSTAVSAWSVALLGVFVAPVVEELLFRGFMYPVLARSTGQAGAIVITGMAFALLHAGQLGFSSAALLVMLVVGVSFTVVRAVSGSVYASMITHFVYNTVQVVIGVIASNGFRNLH